MSLKYFLKFVILPLLTIAVLVFLVFHKPIIRYFTFDKTFDKLIVHRGQAVAVDYVHEILNMGVKAEEPLIDKYNSTYSVVDKYYALYLLGRLHSEKGAPLLLGALKSKESGVRAGAIRGLKYMMKCEYVPAVAALLSDPVRDIRFDAVAALGQVYCPEGTRILIGLVGRERDQNIWARAWLSLRYLLPADGVVVKKFRINKNLQIIPEDQVDAEVGYTYFFLRIREASGEKVVNVTRQTWLQAHIGDTLRKDKESDEIAVIPAPEASR
jgi:hypothetical protein